MNMKKLGLTALASSLVVTSAVAGEMSVAGSASIGLKNTGKTVSGRSWTMGNQLTFSGSGELDNGMNVSLSFVIDQGDDTAIASGPFDSHSVTVSSDTLGTLVFSGEGGSSAQSAIDTTAAGDAWDNGSGITAIRSSEAGNNSLLYTLPSIMDDLTIKGGYSPGGAGGPSATSWSLGYTGVEGLSVDYAQGETKTVGSEQDTQLWKFHMRMVLHFRLLKYRICIWNWWWRYWWRNHFLNLAYTVSDDLSVNYGTETIETEDAAIDEEVDVIGVSYTTGGVTISANQYNASSVGNSNTEAAATGDKERWSLSASFAF